MRAGAGGAGGCEPRRAGEGLIPFLKCVEKVSDTEYVLPRAGDMRVPARASLSDVLFAQTNETPWRQAASAAAYPGMIGLYLMPDIHLGYGWQTANHYFCAGAETQGLPKNHLEDSWLREPLGAEYWAHHNSAANYVVANRYIIVAGAQVALQNIFGARGEVFYEISHNLVQDETPMLPDGSTAPRGRAPKGGDPRVSGRASGPRRDAVGAHRPPVPGARLHAARRGDALPPGRCAPLWVLGQSRLGPRATMRSTEK